MGLKKANGINFHRSIRKRLTAKSSKRAMKVINTRLIDKICKTHIKRI